MKKLTLYLFVTVFLIAGSMLLLNYYVDDFSPINSDTVEISSKVFTDEEIEKLSSFDSELYKRLGSTKESGELNYYFSYFDIPDSVRNNHEFTFYLLEFRHFRELHAFGENKNNETYTTARTLEPDHKPRQSL